MNILSLFDGISCGKVALDRAGIKYDNYFASEVDKYAIQVAKKNHPDIIHLGDVTKVKASDLPQIDLLIGGSPCQGFSFAGKQLNFDDPRSKLFWEYVRLLEECKPKHFLLENVLMKKEYQDVITMALGVDPIEINSALVSAQSRKRLYWTNIPYVTQPEDRGIVLQDIVENGVVDKDKSQIFNHPQRIGEINNRNSQGCRIYSEYGKSVCLNADGGGWGAKTGLYAIAKRGRNIVDGKRQDEKGAKCTQVFETNYSEKANALTSVQKDSMLLDGAIIRKLTPIECERLQTLEDGYTEGISNSQRYKCLGNGWTVDVIVHILNHIGKTKPNKGYQHNLFSQTNSKSTSITYNKLVEKV